MWSRCIWCLVCLTIINGRSRATQHTPSISDASNVTSIPDTEYEQVIAERYLFAPFANESTVWPVLSDIQNAWQVASLPQYHSQAAEGVWLLTQTIAKGAKTGSSFGTLQMSWMSLSANGTLATLSEIDVTSNTSFLVVSHDDNAASLYSAALISPDKVQLILCDRSNAASCKVVQVLSFPPILANTTKITAGVFVEDMGHAGWLYIAADSGLHGLDLSTFTVYPLLNGLNVPVSSLAWSSKQQTVFAGTTTKLWIHAYGTNGEGWRFEHVNGLIDSPITSLAYNDVQNKLWIGQAAGVTLLSPVVMSTGRVHWFFSRLAGQISSPGSDIGHLPFANITTLSVSHSKASDSRTWLGAARGVMRFDMSTTDIDAWRVFNSARYMPDRHSQVDVSSLAVLSRASHAPTNLGSAAVAVTNKGLAVLRFEMWTLAQKAKYFQTFLDQPGRHDKYGLVAFCGMSAWGDTRTCVKGPADSDTLWTSIYLASQVFRYVITQDPEVKVQAWKHFEAMEMLNRVTGISGYPARSFAKRSDFPPRSHWYPSPVYPTLQFQGDTSSDQIVGHQFIYPLVHDLLARNDSERQRTYALLLNITTHILTHDWYLVGENHTRTTWGFWNALQINNDSSHQDDRGLNSLEILAYLLQTYAYSGDERFLNGANQLIELFHYDINLLNQKMIAVCEINFSDDQLAYLSYFNLVYAFDSIASSTYLSPLQKSRAQVLIAKLSEYMQVGLDLSHMYKRMEKSPFYNLIYCYASGQVNQTRATFDRRYGSSAFDCNSLSKDGVWYMQRWPLELIDWQQFNSDRLDVQLNVPAECNKDLVSLRMLPPDERTTVRWTFGVFDLDGGNGLTEEDPGGFLLSYWGMRYFNLLD